MNAKVTATIAVAVVALMVFAAAGATTYSWFYDTEDADIEVTVAVVDISVGWGDDVVGSGDDVTAPNVAEQLYPGSSVQKTYKIMNRSTVPILVKTYAKVETDAVSTLNPIHVVYDGVRTDLTIGADLPDPLGFPGLSHGSGFGASCGDGKGKQG